MSKSNVAAWLTHLRAQRWLFVGTVSGFLFLVVFARFSPLPKDAYAYRDDAVITLSHARNLVDYGSIGIDAAGARVEGFSTPLQLWVFAIVYAITHCGYEVFLDWQVLCCTFLLGFAVVQLFGSQSRIGLPLSAAVAFSLCQAGRFFGWHHSGMENAYTHALFVGTVACIVHSIQVGSVRPWMVICAWLASLTRLESALHVFPLLAIWAIAYRYRHRSLRAAGAALVVIIGWCAYQGFRYAYFGDLQPNTAVAEQIDVLMRVRMLSLDPSDSRGAITSLVGDIVAEHRGDLALLSVPLLVLASRSSANTALVLMLGSLFATALLHPLLFGAARLDPVRTVSHLALVPPLLIATQWARISRTSLRAITLVGVAFGMLVYTRFEPPSDGFFCCPIRRADAIAHSALAHAKREALPAPSLASPDLGKQSFRKRFLMFDLGLLGTPPLAALRSDRRALSNYVFELAAPDFIELHGSWTCEYSYLENDRRFVANYVPVPGARKIGLESGCRNSLAGIWFRQAVSRDSQTPERRLIDDLVKQLEPRRIAEELRRCRQQTGPLACVYVTRSVYRFIPELVQRGKLDAVVALFRESPSALYDQSLLSARSHGRWHKAVEAFARSLAM